MITTGEPRGLTPLALARLERQMSQAQVMHEMRRVAQRINAGLPRRQHVLLPDDASLKTNLSRWERGKVKRMEAHYRRILRELYGRTDDELGLLPAEQQLPQAFSHRSMTSPPADLLDYYQSLRAEHVRADNLMGPHFVLVNVEQEAAALARLVREVRPGPSPALLRVASRYHEFLGWLLQDAGRYDHALANTNRALDFAMELKDPLLNAYTLMRKSNIATDAGEHGLALGTIDAALEVKELRSEIKAVCLRQRANACASAGDDTGLAAAIDQALVAALTDAPTESDLAPYCTGSYVVAEGASAWLTLGSPTRALDLYQSTTFEWSAACRRDQGLGRARLASAHAAVGDLDRACEEAQQAIVLGQATGSARTLTELRRARATLLRTWPRHETVLEISSAVASLVGAAA